jgi:ABC-type antimicrobial peptide transport system permease subunit
LQSKGGTGTEDDEVVVPLSTARELFVGSSSVSTIGVSAASQDDIATVSAEITALLEQRHGIASGSSDDFSITTQAQLLGTVSSVSDVLTFLLAGIASISLLVGGIGIMNIMLVSVTERTREIGLRMSVGARARDILRQFLVEAVVLCLAGGALGILLGHGGSLLVRLVLRWPVETSPVAIAAAVIVSAAVGIVFGYYPAWKASRLDPIEALRYE